MSWPIYYYWFKFPYMTKYMQVQHIQLTHIKCAARCLAAVLRTYTLQHIHICMIIINYLLHNIRALNDSNMVH